MPSASSCRAARTTSSTERLWPRWITSAPWAWISRRMMLMAASWPSNRLAAVTKRSGVASVRASETGWEAGTLMSRIQKKPGIRDCIAHAPGRRRPRPPRSRRLAPDARVAGRRLALRVVARFSFHPDHLPLLDVKVLGCSENRHGRRPFKAQTVQVNPETTVEPCGGSGTCHFRVNFIKWHFAAANSQANQPDLLVPELELTYGPTDGRTRLCALRGP